jgi:hypothetical protein
LLNQGARTVEPRAPAAILMLPLISDMEVAGINDF